MAEVDAFLIAAMGSRGMGKSAWVKQQLKKLKPPRLAVWDLMREYPGEGTTDLGAAVRSMKGARWSVMFYPSGDEKVRAKQFAIWCKALMTVSTKQRQVHAVMEELAFVTRPSWAPGPWQEVTLLGRHHGLNVFGTSQRPASVDKDFLGNCTMVHSCRLNYEDDAKVVSKRLGCKPEDLMNLEQLHYLERGEMDTAAKKGVLKFGPVRAS